MMDIVEQCRKAKEYNLFDADVYKQAADEIERLRKALQGVKCYLDNPAHYDVYLDGIIERALGEKE